MSDFQTLKARVADEMKRGELTACATAVQNAVLDAIAFYRSRRFPWNEFDGELKTTVASTTAVTLSTTAAPKIRDIDSIKITINSRDYILKPRTWRELDAADSGQFFGYPEYYAIHANQIRMYPPPAGAYVLRLAGLQDLVEPSAGSSADFSNAWTTDGEELIRLKAKANLFSNELRFAEEAEYMMNRAQRVYREITKETRGRQSAGRTRPTKF